MLNLVSLGQLPPETARTNLESADDFLYSNLMTSEAKTKTNIFNETKSIGSQKSVLKKSICPGTSDVIDDVKSPQKHVPFKTCHQCLT